GRDAEALADAEEEVLIYRRLSEEVSKGYLQKLAESLEKRARRQVQLGRTKAASFSMEQAIEVYRARRNAIQAVDAATPNELSPPIYEKPPEHRRTDRFKASIELVGALCRGAPILRNQGRLETLFEHFQEALLVLAPDIKEVDMPRESLAAIVTIYLDLAGETKRPTNENLRALLGV
ncbi:MAG: hypothetical protein AAF368_04485, partial [Planctomycetota bacterium]